MPVKLSSETAPRLVSARDLQDGQLAVLEAPVSGYSEYAGRIVQRFSDRLISIGIAWPHGKFGLGCGHKFRVLDPGETIEITANYGLVS